MKNVLIFTFLFLTCSVISYGQIFTNANNINDPTGSAIGENNSVNAPYTTAIGTNNQVNNSQSIGIGHDLDLSGTNSFGFGTLNMVTAPEAMVLGKGLENNLYGNMMLGMQPEIGSGVPPAITIATNNWVGLYRNPNLGQMPGFSQAPGSPLEVWGPEEYSFSVMDVSVLTSGLKQSVFMVPNLDYGGFNGISKEDDKGIFWNDSQGDAGANIESGLVIAPWHHGNRGLRISNEGALKVRASSNYPYGALEVQVKKGSHVQNVFTVPNLSYGSFNGLSREDDKGIFWTDGKQGPGQNAEGGFVLGPWRGEDRGIRITGDGKVGIGLAEPTQLLTVNGNSQFWGKGMFVTDRQEGTLNVEGTAAFYPDMTNNNPSGLQFHLGGGQTSGDLRHLIYDDFTEEALVIEAGVTNGANTSGNSKVIFKGSDVQVQIGEEGVAIGPHADYRLAVDGKVLVKDALIVTPNGWADFVFSPEYELPSLEDIETYIVANGHLPGIPSEQTVKEEGVDLTEMNVRLLQKVEELTLHIIELNKKVASLED